MRYYSRFMGLTKSRASEYNIVSVDRSTTRTHLFYLRVPHFHAPMNPNADAFLQWGCKIIGIEHNASDRLKINAFLVDFKVPPHRCAQIFGLIRSHPTLPTDVPYEPKHLLWSLHFILYYLPERKNRHAMKADRKTLRKFAWPTILALADIAPRYVSWKISTVDITHHAVISSCLFPADSIQ